MTHHPQGNGKPGDVPESEREKPDVLQFRVIDGGALYGGWENTDEVGFACASAQPKVYEVRALYAIPPGFKVVPREVMESYLANASDATFDGFAQSVAADKINSLSSVIYRMGFECGWRMREEEEKS